VVESSCLHVTRIRYEQPRSAGVPTPLPKIMTLCVLPRPPGITRVFSARDRSATAFAFEPSPALQSSPTRPMRKYVWSRKPSVCNPSSSAAARTLVKSTCAVMSCSPGDRSQAGVDADDSLPTLRWLLYVVRVPAECDAEYS